MSEVTPPKRATPRQMRHALWRLKWQNWEAQASRQRRLLQVLAALTTVAAFKLLPIPAEVFALLAIAVVVAFLFGAAVEPANSILPRTAACDPERKSPLLTEKCSACLED